MKQTISNKEVLRLGIQYFAEEGGETPPGSEPTGAEPQAGEGATQETDPIDIAAKLAELEESFAEEKQARIDAEQRYKSVEKSLVDTERKLKKTERAKMTEAELLEDQRREFEEERASFQIEANTTRARAILSALDIPEHDLADDVMDFLVSQDKDRTTDRCQWFVDVSKKLMEAARLSEREKVLKEMPAPPAGDKAQGTLSRQDEMRSQLFPKH